MRLAHHADNGADRYLPARGLPDKDAAVGGIERVKDITALPNGSIRLFFL